LNIFDAAEYFVSKVEVETGEVITHLKLQKLVYYAQAWHLAIHKKRLFNAHFEAWAHGPVNPELFQAYREYGFNPIPFPEDFELSSYTKNERQFLDEIWDVYGKYDAKYLEHLTHQEEPWIEARGGLPDGMKCTTVISEKTMADFYEGYIDEEN